MYTGDMEKTQAPPDRDALISKQVQEREYLRRGPEQVQTSNLAGRPYSDSEIVAELFKYHSPTVEQLPRYSAINQAAKNFAEVILANCPPGTDRSTAIYHIRLARMTANAAIALNGLSL